MVARRKIVVGTDFSTRARAALARALRLAQDRHAELIVVHSVATAGTGAPPGLPAAWGRGTGGASELASTASGARARRHARRGAAVPAAGSAPIASDVANAAATLAARKLGHLQETLDGVAVATRMSYGQAHADIVRIARVERAMLVVTGTHHPRGAFERFFLGSTADRVLRLGSCPVLVVRRPASAPYDTVVVPVDFSTSSSQALRFLRRLLPDVRPVVVHVLAPAGMAGASVEARREQALERLRKLVVAAGYGRGVAELSAVVGDPRAEILVTAERAGADLIAMGTHGRTGLHRLILGSVAEYVIRAFKGDVLAVPPSAG